MHKMNTVLLLFIILIIAGENFALPRFALRQGGMCIDCHVNPTGGNMRNDGGWFYGKNVMPMRTTEKDFQMTNRIGDNIQFGFDLRGNFLVTQTDSTTKADFQKMTGTLYGNVEFSEKIDAFMRYDFIWQIWEGYTVMRVLPNDSYIKGGVFQPNFGIRIDDHTAYTRGGDLGIITGQIRGLIYGPTYLETGVEVGINISSFGLFTASAGSPSTNFRPFQTDPTYTASLQLMPMIGDVASVMIGGSFANFKRNITNPATGVSYLSNVNMFGGFLGFGIGDFTIMGEYDIANDYLAKDIKTAVMMAKANYRIIKGLEAAVRYDRFDPNQDVAKDELQRIIVGLEIFPFSFMEIRPQYRIQMEEPSVKNNTFVVQTHIYY